ncbi:MAG: double zinc ribbon domain-containing protein [Actinomycetota bacterium]
MTCEACGATNPETARWCNQCLAPLRGADDHPDGPPVAGEPAQEEGSGAPAEAWPAPAPHGDHTQDGGRGWSCPVCGTVSATPDATCPTCGADLAAHSLRQSEVERPPPPWTLALVLSALAPGAGHVLLRRYASATARLLLFLVWAVGGIAVLSGGAGAALVAAPLLLGAAVLWLGSLGDVALASQEAGRELLGARVLLWLVVAVTGLTLLGAVASLQLVTT